jgi:hypothetical protein
MYNTVGRSTVKAVDDSTPTGRETAFALAKPFLSFESTLPLALTNLIMNISSSSI